MYVWSAAAVIGMHQGSIFCVVNNGHFISKQNLLYARGALMKWGEVQQRNQTKTLVFLT